MVLSRQAESGMRNSLLFFFNIYTQSNADHSLFIKKTATSFTVLLVYVDDVIVAGDSLDEFQFIKNILHSSFKIKDLGQLIYFFGLEVVHSSQGNLFVPEKLLP